MIPANKVIPSIVAEVVRKAPLTDEKVAFAWRLAAGAAIAKATTVRLASDGTLHVAAESSAWIDAVHASIGLIRSRLAHLLGDDSVKQLACRTTRSSR